MSNWHPDGPIRRNLKGGLPRTLFKKKPLGLGDVVAAVAHPFAKAIDAIAGTDLENCVGCERRRRRLNKAVPDARRPFRRPPA